MIDWKVAAFVDGAGQWNWELFSSLLPTETWKKIGGIPPPRSTQGRDTLIWKDSKSGRFSTSSAYKSLCDGGWHQEEKKWKLIWGWKGPEKIKTFLWLLMRGALLTNAERKRRHLSEDPRCHLCGEEESIWHVMRDCYRSQHLWKRIKQDLGAPFWTETNIVKWLEINLNSSLLQDQAPWSLWFGITCWKLWRIRNEEEIAGLTIRGTEVVYNIHAMVKEVQWTLQGFGTSDDRLGSNNSELGWKPPSRGWIKLNTDGSMRKDVNQATAGGALRNCNGEWLVGFAYNIGSCSPLEAEIWGAVKGLEIAWNRGYKRVLLELDSSDVVDIIKEEVLDQGCTSLIRCLKNLLQLDWDVQTKHISRRCNMVADSLAKMAHALPIGIRVFETPPMNVGRIVWGELLDISSWQNSCPRQ